MSVRKMPPEASDRCHWPGVNKKTRLGPEAAVRLAAFQLALLGAEFTVLEPPELIDHVRTLAGRLSRASPIR